MYMYDIVYMCIYKIYNIHITYWLFPIHRNTSCHPAVTEPQFPPFPAEASKLVGLRSSTTHWIHCIECTQHCIT